MKNIATLIFFLLFPLLLHAQTVENIRVEQEGENLLIHYRIGASTDDQLYDVELTCSIDKGPVFEPKSVIGDVGKNIRGGKSFNTIVWDVFEDVEEIGSVEFFVEVILVKDESKTEPLTAAQTQPQTISNQPTMINQQPVVNQAAPDKGKQRKGFHLSYSGGSKQQAGIMLGTLKNWGLYGSLRAGYDYFYMTPLASLSGGLTKRFTDGEQFDLYGYSGIGAASDGYYTNFEFEAGFTGLIMDRVTISLGFAYMGYYLGSDGILGVGILF